MVWITVCVYPATFFDYLPSIIPLLAITLTNLLLISGSIFLMTIGKAYTRLNLVVDDDVRNFELDQMQAGASATFGGGYYLYIVRLYFINLFHLENENSGLMLDDTSIEDEDGSIEEGNIVDDLLKMEKRKRKQKERDRSRILIIEMVNQNRRHLTKLELNLPFLRKCYIHKIPYITAVPTNNLKQEHQLDGRDQLKGSLYLVKFLFERNRPLTSNVAFLRIRQLSSSLPLFLYRVEIQDTAQENSGIACHVNDVIETVVKCFPTLTSDHYSPSPLDRAFNSTKLIWTEMTLFLLLGLNVLTLISLCLLDYSEVYEYKSLQSASCLFWTQALFGSGLSALVVIILDAAYRIFTYRRPQYRKITLHVLTILLSLVVISLSVTCTIIGFNNSHIYEFHMLRFWVEGYFSSLLIYGLFSIVIVAGDVCIFHYV